MFVKMGKCAEINGFRYSKKNCLQITDQNFLRFVPENVLTNITPQKEPRPLQILPDLWQSKKEIWSYAVPVTGVKRLRVTLLKAPAFTTDPFKSKISELSWEPKILATEVHQGYLTTEWIHTVPVGLDQLRISASTPMLIYILLER